MPAVALSRAGARVVESVDSVTESQALTCDPATLSIPAAALARYALEDAARLSVDQLLREPDAVVGVLRRFESAMRRWRWDPETLQVPIRWRIDSEREVQDILFLMLRGVFEDLIDEQPLAKLGHAGFRADFAVPSLGVLIEVKYVRVSADFKKVEKEVMEDVIGYTSSGLYREVVVFIYDDSASVEHHQLTEAALLSVPSVSGVVVVSRPGMLPSREDRATAM